MIEAIIAAIQFLIKFFWGIICAIANLILIFFQ